MKKTQNFEFNELLSILKQNVKPNARNFLYLASGCKRDRENTYLNLPYDNIFLVDKSMRCQQIVSDKIYYIKADATEAVEVFRKAGVKMDFYTSIQEGLNEGGASYPLNTNAYYGFVLPILKDKYIHFLHRCYVKHIKRLPYKTRTKINPEHEDYINPELLTTFPQSAEFWRVETRIERMHNIKIKNINLQIRYKSIWEDIDELDLVFGGLDETMKSKLQNKEKIIKIKSFWRNEDKYIEQCNNLLEHCNEKKAVTIGMLPFGWGDYKGFLDWLENTEFAYTKEIRLYHIAKNDFQYLYSV